VVLQEQRIVRAGSDGVFMLEHGKVLWGGGINKCLMQLTTHGLKGVGVLEL